MHILRRLLVQLFHDFEWTSHPGLNGHTAKGLRSTGTGAVIKHGITNGKISVQNAIIKNVIATRSGLMVWGSCILLNITAKDNDHKGIYIQGNKNRLINVTAESNGGDGIYVNGDNNRLYNATATDNGSFSIRISGDNNQVKDSSIAQQGASWCMAAMYDEGIVFKNYVVCCCYCYGVVIEGGLAKTFYCSKQVLRHFLVLDRSRRRRMVSPTPET